MTPENDLRISLTSPLQKACTSRGVPLPLFTRLPRRGILGNPVFRF